MRFNHPPAVTLSRPVTRAAASGLRPFSVLLLNNKQVVTGCDSSDRGKNKTSRVSQPAQPAQPRVVFGGRRQRGQLALPLTARTP